MKKKFPKAILITTLLVLALVIASCGSAATVTQTGTVTQTTTATATVTSTPTPPATTVQPPPAVKNPDTFVAVTIGDVDSLDRRLRL